MLSPDNYVQMPDFTQNFNRYSYCLNNPLKYTDPTGNNYVSDMYHGNNGGGDYFTGWGSSNLSRNMGGHFNAGFGREFSYQSNGTYVTNDKGESVWVYSDDITTVYDASWGDMFNFDVDRKGNTSFNIDYGKGKSGASIVIDANMNVDRIWGDIKFASTGGGNVQEANLTDALPLSVVIGSMLAEIAPTAIVLLSQAAGILTLLTIPGDNRIGAYTENPVMPRPFTTSRGNQTNWPINTNDNGNFPNEIPWWFMPFAVGGGAYDIYQNNWAKPNMPVIPKPKKSQIIVPYRY